MAILDKIRPSDDRSKTARLSAYEVGFFMLFDEILTGLSSLFVWASTFSPEHSAKMEDYLDARVELLFKEHFRIGEKLGTELARDRDVVQEAIEKVLGQYGYTLQELHELHRFWRINTSLAFGPV